MLKLHHIIISPGAHYAVVVSNEEVIHSVEIPHILCIQICFNIKMFSIKME